MWVVKTYLTSTQDGIDFNQPQQFGRFAYLGLIGNSASGKFGLYASSAIVSLGYNVGIAHYDTAIYVLGYGVVTALYSIVLSHGSFGLMAFTGGVIQSVVTMSAFTRGVYAQSAGWVNMSVGSWLTGGYYGVDCGGAARVGLGTNMTLEAQTVALHAVDTALIFNGAHVYFLDCTTSYSPALDTQGNEYALILSDAAN